MNHDPKYNDFEYEKENYPKTPEHFKQFVAAHVSLLRKLLPKKKLLLFPTTQIPYHQLPLYLKKTDLLLLFLTPGRMLFWKCMIMTASTKNSQINI